MSLSKENEIILKGIRKFLNKEMKRSIPISEPIDYFYKKNRLVRSEIYNIIPETKKEK